MKSLTLAVPKGRILKELLPLFEKAKIIPEKDFLNSASRKLLFKTNLKGLNLIKVRSFDVATFVAIGAAQIGVAGDDVIEEFNYEEIYSTLDLKIGKCRLSIASKETKKRLIISRVILWLLLNIKILLQIILLSKELEQNALN